ncbi:Rieske 2Fe-2S domain-containing protein [Saccharopolyspora sp. NPDC003752]
MSAAEVDEDEIRNIEAAEINARFTRGWHCLGLARDFSDGKPHTVAAFGGKLVVFEGQDGTLNALDAYCRHMGGDLSQGTVKGDEIACPFHDWRWGGDGRCKQIPYARRVPVRARTAAWPTLVQDGMLFVWNDPEGNPPIEEQAIPAIKEFAEGDWTDWWWSSMVVHTNCREVIDNVVDMAHFFYVHKAFPRYFKNIFEGHIATQYFDGTAREDVVQYLNDVVPTDGPQFTGSESVASYFGPSFMIDWLNQVFEDGPRPIVQINAHYPIDKNSFLLHFGVRMQKHAGMTDANAAEVAEKSARQVLKGFLEDVKIWKSKTRIDNPLLCEEDGPVYQLRRWYEQFYVDIADVAPEMTNRFEFEIDTTKAVEAWEREVAENLARGAETDAPA